MKRYLLFAGSNYYPNGGINDLRGYFETIEEANVFFFEWIMRGFHYSSKENEDQERKECIKMQKEFSWGHIFDSKTGEKINIWE